MAAKSFIGDVALDVLLSEREVAQVQTTEHPVESGADPTDHARELPLQLVLEALLSGLPTAAEASTGTTAPRTSTSNPATQAYETLRDMRSKRQAVTVITTSRRYENMMITELARVRNPALGPDTVQFTCNLKEIRFVNTEQVRLVQAKKPTTVPKKPTGEAKQGKKVAEEAEQDRSWAKQLTDEGGLTSPGDGLNR